MYYSRTSEPLLSGVSILVVTIASWRLLVTDSIASIVKQFHDSTRLATLATVIDPLMFFNSFALVAILWIWAEAAEHEDLAFIAGLVCAWFICVGGFLWVSPYIPIPKT